MAQTGQRADFVRDFNFLVEIDNIAQASFTECTGVGTTTEVIEIRQGGDNTRVMKFPGKTSCTDVTLKWGMTDSTELWDWRQQIIDGQVVLKNGALIAFDLTNHIEMARWNFTNAWPTKFEVPAFNAKGNAIAIETLVLAVESLTRG